MAATKVVVLRKGRWVARLARDAADRAAVYELRARVFRNGAGSDRDAFDATSRHMMVIDQETGRLVCAYRFAVYQRVLEALSGYSAQFYDLNALNSSNAKLAELGRFCVDPDVCGDSDIVRVAWAAMTRIVDQEGIRLLFGCSSFSGTEFDPYRDAFRLLGRRYGLDGRYVSLRKSKDVIPFDDLEPCEGGDRRGWQLIPPLLRTYLQMGGWVSDHAVVDRDLNTLHVFTCVDVQNVPEPRARLLRQLAKADV